jgi:hypothetical protein
LKKAYLDTFLQNLLKKFPTKYWKKKEFPKKSSPRSIGRKKIVPEIYFPSFFSSFPLIFRLSPDCRNNSTESAAKRKLLSSGGGNFTAFVVTLVPEK